MKAEKSKRVKNIKKELQNQLQPIIKCLFTHDMELSCMIGLNFVKVLFPLLYSYTTLVFLYPQAPLFLGVYPKKMDKWWTENIDFWEETLKLIPHCIFDNLLHIWRLICLEQLCQQAQTRHWGTALAKNFMWFILLGVSRFPLTKKNLIWRRNSFQIPCFLKPWNGADPAQTQTY